MELIQSLNWRYAAKRMTGERVTKEKLDNILEAIRLSASSGGLQPYSIIVIDNEDTRKKIQPVAYNQPQIMEASHLIIFAAWENITAEKTGEYVNRVSAVRGIPVDKLEGLTNMFANIISRPADVNFDWAARQAYIALGTGLIAAANEKVDATPMEGFDPKALDEVLGLKEKGLRSVALLALGYRDTTNDYSVNMPKVRREKDDLFIVLN